MPSSGVSVFAAEEKSAVDRARELSEKNKELVEENKAYENKMLDYVNQITVKEKQLAELGKKLGSALDELKSSQAEEAAQENEVTRLKEIQAQYEAQTEEVQKLKFEIQKLTTDLEALQKIQADYQASQETMKKNELDSKMVSQEKRVLEDQLEKMTAELETVKQERSLLENSLNDAKKNEEKQRVETQVFDSQKAAFETAKATLETRIKALSSETEALQKERDGLKASLETFQKNDAAYETEQKKNSEERARLIAAKKELEDKAVLLNQELDKLRKERDELLKSKDAAEKDQAGWSAEKKSLEAARQKVEKEKTELEIKLKKASAEWEALKKNPPTSALPKKDQASRFFVEDAEDLKKESRAGAVTEDPELAAASKTLNQIQKDLAGADGAPKVQNVTVPEPDSGSEFLLDKSVRRPKRERLAAWQAPGLQDLSDPSDVLKDTEVAVPDSSGDPRIQEERLKDAQYYSELLKAKTARLEAENAEKDRSIERLREELRAAVRKMEKKQHVLSQELQEEREENQDHFIQSQTQNENLTKASKKEKSKTVSGGEGARQKALLQKKIQGLRADARKDREDYYYNLGVVLMREGRFKKAAYLFEKALHLDPLDASAHYNLGILYDDHLDEPKKAIRHYEAFLKLSRNHDQVRDVAKWLKIIQDYYGSGGRMSRVQSMRQAVEELFFTAPY